MHLLLAGRTINRDEHRDNFNLGNPLVDLLGVDEQPVLVEAYEGALEGFLPVSLELLELGEEAEQCLSTTPVLGVPFVDGVSQRLSHLHQGFHVVNMESESVPISGLIEVSAVGTVPNSDVTGNLCGDKLCESAKGSHGVGIAKSKDEMLSGVWLDIF